MRIIIWKRILTCNRKKRGGTEAPTYMLMCQVSLGAMAVTATGHEQLILVFRKLALCVLLYSLSLSFFLILFPLLVFMVRLLKAVLTHSVHILPLFIV